MSQPSIPPPIPSQESSSRTEIRNALRALSADERSHLERMLLDEPWRQHRWLVSSPATPVTRGPKA